MIALELFVNELTVLAKTAIWLFGAVTVVVFVFVLAGAKLLLLTTVDKVLFAFDALELELLNEVAPIPPPVIPLFTEVTATELTA